MDDRMNDRLKTKRDGTLYIRSGADVTSRELRSQRRRWLTRTEFLARWRRAQADPGMRDDLATLAGDTTDDLGPNRGSSSPPSP